MRIKIYEVVTTKGVDGNESITLGDLLFADGETITDSTVRFVGLTKSILQSDPNLKDAETIDYPEEDGYRIIVNPNFQSYTYSFTLSCILSNEAAKDEINKSILVNIQRKIQGKRVAVFNLYRQQKIVGYCLNGFSIGEAYKKAIGTNYRDMVDFEVEVEVTNPSLCNLLNVNDLP